MDILENWREKEMWQSILQRWLPYFVQNDFKMKKLNLSGSMLMFKMLPSLLLSHSSLSPKMGWWMSERVREREGKKRMQCLDFAKRKRLTPTSDDKVLGQSVSRIQLIQNPEKPRKEREREEFDPKNLPSLSQTSESDHSLSPLSLTILFKTRILCSNNPVASRR